MSLIADALKAAQGENNHASAGSPGSRRVIAASVLSRRGAATRAPAGGAKVPRSVGLATAVFAVALVVSIGVIALPPGGGMRMKRSAAASEGTPVDEPAARTAAVEPTPGAAAEEATEDAPQEAPEAASIPAPSAGRTGSLSSAFQTAALLRARTAQVAAATRTDPEVGAVTGLRQTAARISSAPGGIAGAPGAAAPAASSAAAPPAARTETPPGRFQIVVDPAAPASDPLADAIVAHRRGDHAAAIVLYQRSLAANPRNGQALNHLGAAYQASGQLALARDAFRRAVDLNARDAAAWASLGVVLGAMGESGEAQAALGEAVRLDPANQGAKVNLANHFLARGLPADARRLLDEVVRSEPGHAEAHYALGRLSEQQGDRPGAARHYRAFLDNARGRFPQLEGPVRSRIAQLGEG